MDISCGLATSVNTPEHIAVAESLGYRRAWCYDSPAIYSDVWMALGLAAARTERIGLGTAVLVPSLRHPMVNAAAIAGLAQMAPGRVAVTLGTGFTGRVTLGQKALPWAQVREYVIALKALLRGEKVEWEGATIGMIHLPGFVAPRPVDASILLAANGPKGLAIANELADGVMFGGPMPGGPPFTIPAETKPAWRAVGSVWGTVVDDGEDLASDRVLDAAGPALAMLYHGSYEMGGAAAVDRLPGGEAWRATIETVPPNERHLLIHEGHLCGLTDRDRQAVRTAGSMLPAVTLTGSAAEVRAKADAIAEVGATELIYQPSGDIPRELERMAGALGL